MLSGFWYIALGVLAMALATLITRVFPFALFSRRQVPEWLVRGARLIPGAVMLVLVFTSMPLRLSNLAPDLWIPWLSVAVTAAAHWYFRHPLFSIILGTACYMLLSALLM
jgi:branched-subunit amino acid transport protein AzlD